ncbi:MAG: Rid family hydrolase [bacterium]
MLIVAEGPGDLVFLSWLADPTPCSLEKLAERAYDELAGEIQSRRAVLLSERIYGSVDSIPPVLKIRQAVLERRGCPVEVPPTCVEGKPFSGSGFAGIHALALRSPLVPDTPVVFEGKACGAKARGSDAEYLCLADVGQLARGSQAVTPAGEARTALTLAEQILEQERWSFHDVRRTWFYLDNILDWYGEFNAVRNQAFKQMGLLNGNPLTLVPASTGIHGRNALGGWCTLDLLAMKPVEGQPFETRRLKNPKQNEAISYGSAFSRGLSIKTATSIYLFVSGTASIDEQGKTVHSGNFERQVQRTVENVEALLTSAGARLEDICQATTFVKNINDVDQYAQIASRLGIDEIPAINTIADVCRDDLLFELDATVVLPCSTIIHETRK